MTNSERTADSAVVMSSTMPSAKYSCSGSPLMFWNGNTTSDGLSGSGKFYRRHAEEVARLIFGTIAAFIGSQHKRLNRPRDVFKLSVSELFEYEIETPVHMVAHRSRDAHGAWRAFRLEPCRHIHRVAV